VEDDPLVADGQADNGVPPPADHPTGERPPPWEDEPEGGPEPLWAENLPRGGAPDDDDEPPTVEQPSSAEETPQAGAVPPGPEGQPPGESEPPAQPGDEPPSGEQLPLGEGEEERAPAAGEEAAETESGGGDGEPEAELEGGDGEPEHEAAEGEHEAGEGASEAGEGASEAGSEDAEAGEGAPEAGEGAPEAGEGAPEAGEGAPEAGEGAPEAAVAEPEAEEEPDGPPWGSGPPPWERGGFWGDEEEEPEDAAAIAGAAAPLGAEDLATRRDSQRIQRRRAGQRRLLALIAGLVVLIIVIAVATSGGGSPIPRPTTTTTTTGSAFAHTGTGPSHLAVDIDHSALTQNILIADRNNNRLLSISPLGQTVAEMSNPSPSDSSLSSTGHTVFVTQHVQSVVLARRVDNHSIVFTYGHPGKTGTGDNRLHDPATAQETSSGELVIADRGNCRVLFVAPPSHTPVQTWGTPGECTHHVTSLPMTFAYPSSAFASSNGDVVVTEQNPAWVDILTKDQRLVSAIQLLDFTAPMGANEYETNHIIVVDRTHPGKIVEFDFSSSSSTLVRAWSYPVTTGEGELNHPTLALVLPNGDVLVADSGNDRVIVIDPADNKIVWQYGHTHVSGSSAGYLHTPESVALVPNKPPG
jgi:hypothetical protein